MNKKILIFAVFFAVFAFPSFSKTGFEVGLGSGYVFYGSRETKDKNAQINDSNQILLSTDASFLFFMNEIVAFSLGADSVFDLRWSKGSHTYLVDYAFLGGVRIYPNFGGLFASVDYALGRRTDFISIEDSDAKENTKWGNGFKFAIGYDFSYHLNFLAPELVVSLRSMPRGGSRDTILGVSLKLTRHK